MTVKCKKTYTDRGIDYFVPGNEYEATHIFDGWYDVQGEGGHFFRFGQYTFADTFSAE